MSVSLEKVEAFLADLSQLYEKHGLALDGCGCCMSPYVTTLDKPNMGGGGEVSHASIKDAAERAEVAKTAVRGGL